MFPYKIFKRALKRTFPKVHGKPTFCGVQRYITDITLEFRSSLCWISIDLHGTDKGYVTLWEGSAK